MHRYLLLFLSLASISSSGFGQNNPGEKIPKFDFDDFYEEPKFSMQVGIRALSGAKTAFAGNGSIASFSNINDSTSTDVERGYHDGSVLFDLRKNSTDGKTDHWGVAGPLQISNDNADIAFHTYSAQTTDNSTRSNDHGLSLGAEIVLSREMGKIGSRIEWLITGGISFNGLQAGDRDFVTADITTVTDVYSLDGQAIPIIFPYSAPTFGSDADGNRIETSILIGRSPDSRTETTTSNDTQVESIWKLRGTFVTVRVGPTLRIQIAGNLRFIVSGGPALVYSGTTYSVDNSFEVETGQSLLINHVESTEGVTMVGYYADVALEYLLSDFAGIYMGGFFQSSGEYTQKISENASSYTLDVDLSRLQGFRGGLTFKF